MYDSKPARNLADALSMAIGGLPTFSRCIGFNTEMDRDVSFSPVRFTPSRHHYITSVEWVHFDAQSDGWRQLILEVDYRLCIIEIKTGPGSREFQFPFQFIALGGSVTRWALTLHEVFVVPSAIDFRRHLADVITNFQLWPNGQTL